MVKTSKKPGFQPGQSGNPNGRPRRYTKAYVEGELVQKLDKWIEKRLAEGEPLWINGFAIDERIPVSTFSVELNNPEKYPLFSKAYARAFEAQQRDIVDNALKNRYNSQFAQFVLKNNHGWKDKSEVEQTTIEGYKPPSEGSIAASEERREKFLKLKRG